MTSLNLDFKILILQAIVLSEFLKGFGQLLGYSMIILIPWLAPRVEKWFKNKADYFGHNLKIRKQINDHLAEIRIALNADRVCLFEFSNTDKSISQYPFEYLNMTYEKVSASTSEIRDEWQKKHIKPHVDFLEMFSDSHGPMTMIIDSHDYRINEGVRMNLLAYNIESCLICKMHKELRYGFIAVHFINRSYKGRWDLVGVAHQDQERLKVKAHLILQLQKSLQ
jgi:hypothetical protein